MRLWRRGVNALRGALPAGVLLLAALPASAQERVYHAFGLPADHNQAFAQNYPAADRLLNAFDYGHGILYETLWTRAEAPPELLEDEIYARLVNEVLARPPRLAMPEAAFMPQYARLVPRAKGMFDLAHVLHKQAYDILADPSLDAAGRDAAMEELLDWYGAQDLAFNARPKAMAIMDDQAFSRVFRERNPKFNGLIWAYHWLQVAIYEPLLVFSEAGERQAGVAEVVARFWQMVASAPEGLPSEMPMTPAIAPTFTARYPGAAAIFDNLHMMHDVISDILVSPEVPRDRTREEIYRQIGLFQDADHLALSDDAWIAMALGHGTEAQGGPALGWMRPPPGPPAMEDGMDHDDHGDHAPAAPSDGTPPGL